MNKIDIDIDKVAKQALKETAFRIATHAKQTCPIDTGNLLSSISYKVEDLEAIVSAGGMGFSKNVDYAQFVEDKTHFFSEAFEAEKSIDIHFD